MQGLGGNLPISSKALEARPHAGDTDIAGFNQKLSGIETIAWRPLALIRARAPRGPAVERNGMAAVFKGARAPFLL